MPERITLGDPADIRGSMHISCGKKGGIGKSFVCRIFTEAVMRGLETGDLAMPQDGSMPDVLDADPANHTLSYVNGLNARDSNIYTKSNQIRSDSLDSAFMPDEKRPEEIRIIDMGSIGYMDIFEYMQETNIPGIWREDGKSFFFHTPLMGHERLQETLLSLAEIMDTFPDAQIFVWCNDYAVGSGTAGSLSVQQFLRMQLEKLVEINSQGKDAESELPPLHDVVEQSRRQGFSHFAPDDLALTSIYYQAYLRTRQFKQYVVLANAETDGLRHISASIRDVLGRYEMFTDFINGTAARGSRYRVAKFIYGTKEKPGVFFNIYKGLQVASGINVDEVYS